MPSTEPDRSRYRCGACGNLTRFDVVETVRTREYHHFTIGGELNVDETEVLVYTVNSVECRWCGHGNNIQIMEEETGSPEGE